MITRLACSALLLLLSLLSAKETPADSLLQNESTTLRAKVFLYPISAWQDISYSTDHLQCQFEPSCSHFMALAIQEYGPLRGIVAGSDRLLRCNPTALGYHLKSNTPQFTADGRLLDPVLPENSLPAVKNKYLAAGLSIIPGLGRTYAGHGWDGLLSFMLISSLGFAAYSGYENGNQFTVYFTGSLALTFWLADVYGAFRTAAGTGN